MTSKTKRLGLLLAAAILPLGAVRAELVADWAMNGPAGDLCDGSGNGLAAAASATGLAYGQAGVPAGTYGDITLDADAAAALGPTVNFSAGGVFSVAATPLINNLLSNGTGNFTVMAWVRTTALTPSTGYRIFATGRGGSNGWGFGMANVDRAWFTAFGCNDFYSATTVATNAGWHHVALTVSGNAWTLYADARPLGSGTLSGYRNSSEPAFLIGQAVGGGTQFKGDLGHLRLYDTALTPAQLAAEAVTAYLEVPTLTAGQLAALPPGRVATLTLTQIGALTPAQAAGFTAAQLAALPAGRIGAFSPGLIAALSPSAIGGLSGTQLAGLSDGQLGAFSSAQVAAIDPAAIPFLTARQLRGLTPGQLDALTAAQTAALTPDQSAVLAAAGSLASMTITLHDEVSEGLLVTTVVDLAGVSSSTHADGAGRVRKMTDGLGKVSLAAYSAEGELLSRVDPTGAGTDYAYDALGRKLTETDRNVAGKVRSYTYDAAGRLTTTTDPLGIVTTYGYDLRDRLASESTPMTGSETRLIRYAYDGVGNRLTLTDANNAVTTWTYDAANRNIAKLYANGDHRSMAYDAAGRLVTLTDENGHAVTSSYDLAGRLVAKAYAADGSTDAFVYDAASRILSATKGRYGHTLTYAYDKAGRPAAETHPDGTVITQVYDSANRLANLALTAGAGVPPVYSVDYAYDGRGLLASVTSGDYASTYAYRDNGQLASTLSSRRSTPAGDILRADRSYDAGGRLTQVANTAANTDQAGVLYTLGLDDQRLTATEESGERWNYGYDGLKQLVTAKKTDTGAVVVPPLDQSYAYDPMGNRRSATDQSGSTAYTANNANQYAAVGGIASVYDHNGNLLSDGVKNYAWDADNQLLSVSPVFPAEGALRVDYAYDWRMRRTSKTSFVYASGAWTVQKTTGYKYHEWNPVEESASAAGSVTEVKRYVWGNDLSGGLHGAGGVGGLLSMSRLTTGATVPENFFYAYDGNGNVRALVKADAANPAASAIVERYAYDGFGRELDDSTPAASSVNSIRFSTKQADPETGMNYYGMRFYDSNNGRWINRDPIAEEGGNNIYAMVDNDSINKYDVLGMACGVHLNKCEAKALACAINSWKYPAGFGLKGIDMFLPEGVLIGYRKWLTWKMLRHYMSKSGEEYEVPSELLVKDRAILVSFEQAKLHFKSNSNPIPIFFQTEGDMWSSIGKSTMKYSLISAWGRPIIRGDLLNERYTFLDEPKGEGATFPFMAPFAKLCGFKCGVKGSDVEVTDKWMGDLETYGHAKSYNVKGRMDTFKR